MSETTGADYTGPPTATFHAQIPCWCGKSHPIELKHAAPDATAGDEQSLAELIYTAWTGQKYWGGCDQRESVERVVPALRDVLAAAARDAEKAREAHATDPILVSSMRRWPTGEVRHIPGGGIGMSGMSPAGFLAEYDEAIAAAYQRGFSDGYEVSALDGTS